MNPKVQTLKSRHQIFQQVRKFFDTRAFFEVHTPLLVKNPGLEPHLHYFETRFEPDLGGGRAQEFYLPTSPEYHLKKSLAWPGVDRIFEITRSFRNGELSAEHEPEFFMLEWYRHPGNYREIADDFSALMQELGAQWAPSKAWDKRCDLTVAQAFRTYCDLDLDAALKSPKGLTQQARAKGFTSIHETDNFDTCFQKLLVERIESKLGFAGPLFLWDYPSSQCALARLKPENPLYCERFEVYWRGVELANAFGELTDAAEQRRRNIKDQSYRKILYGKSPELDEDFLQALSQIEHPVGGIAVGLDRLIQLLLEKAQVQDVVAFPHKNSL